MQEHYPAGTVGWKGLIVLVRGGWCNPLPARGHMSLQQQEREGPEGSGCGGRSQGKSPPGRKGATWGTQRGEGSARRQVWKHGKSMRSSLSEWVCARTDLSDVTSFCGCCNLFHSPPFFSVEGWERRFRRGRKSCTRLASGPQEMANSSAEGDDASFLSVLQLAHSKNHHAGFKTVALA